MTIHTQICPLTKVEKSFEIIAEGFCVNSFKNGKGETSVGLYKIVLPSSVAKVATFVAERDANDLSEIKDELKFYGVKEDVSNELNQYLISKLA